MGKPFSTYDRGSHIGASDDARPGRRRRDVHGGASSARPRHRGRRLNSRMHGSNGERQTGRRCSSIAREVTPATVSTTLRDGGGHCCCSPGRPSSVQARAAPAAPRDGTVAASPAHRRHGFNRREQARHAEQPLATKGCSRSPPMVQVAPAARSLRPGSTRPLRVSVAADGRGCRHRCRRSPPRRSRWSPRRGRRRRARARRSPSPTRRTGAP